MTDQPDSPANAPDVRLDLTGLNCPLPVLKTKKALAEMVVGQILHATTTDPMSTIDMTVFCERSGHELLKTIEHRDSDPDQFEFVIRKGSGA